MKAKSLILLSLIAGLTLLVPGETHAWAAQAVPVRSSIEGYVLRSIESKGEWSATVPGQAQAMEALQSAPVMFIENVGQFADGARFQVRGGDHAVWLADDALWVVFMKQPDQKARGAGDNRVSTLFSLRLVSPSPWKGVNLKLSFPGASPRPHLEPFNRLDTHISYFTGDDPKQWYTDVPVWGGVRYLDIYPGLDLEITSQNGRLVQRLVVREDSAALQLGTMHLWVEGADTLTLDSDHMHLMTPVGEFTLPLLSVKGAVVDSQPVPLNVARGIFQVTSPLSQPRPSRLFVSPQDNPSALLYSTFLGGNDSDIGTSIAVGADGMAYVTGHTSSPDFPTTPGAFDTAYAPHNYDVFVAKLNAAGSGLEYATFLGGADGDFDSSIAVDRAGMAYVTGQTRSSDFPSTPDAFDKTCGTDGNCNSDGYHRYEDAFIVKLNATGSALQYATFLGGEANDISQYIAIGEDGAVFVTGYTVSSDFPFTPNAFDKTCGTDGNCNGGRYDDAFIVKLNAAGSALQYATFLGGEAGDLGQCITIDKDGAAFVTGHTLSPDFPLTPDAFDKTCGTDGNCNGPYSDIFVVKLDPTGSALDYATFLGGSDDDWGNAIVLDATGAAYVTGCTVSSDFPTTPGAFDIVCSSGSNCESPHGDAFVAKLNPAGSALSYSTFLGGSRADTGRAIAVDATGAAYVTGGTQSSGFPTVPGSFDTTYNGGDADVFVVRLNATGSALQYATFLGGSGQESGSAVAVDGAGVVYITGDTGSLNFPVTPDAFDTTYNNDWDAFITKLTVGGAFLDLPVSYSNFAQAAQGNVDGSGPRRVSSWFDHTYPNYGMNCDATIWSSRHYTGCARTNRDTCDTGVSCYDGHNGIDFQSLSPSEQVFAAAPGTVINIVTTCQKGKPTCGGRYGNQVWIDHHNRYATLYAHLEMVSVTAGMKITDTISQPLGVMGETGSSKGVHLHFGTYYDQNGDGQWMQDEVVDPYGWDERSGPDLWSVRSHYLWKHPLWTLDTGDSSGTVISSPSGNVSVTIPAGALTSTVTLELWDTPPVAEPLAQLRTTGHSFWLRVLQWLTGNNASLNTLTDDSGFSQPITVSVTYGVTEVLHLNSNQLTVYHWDDTDNTWEALTTTMDIKKSQAIAQTTEIGSFDLQAPLLCPTDSQEPDDSYDAARAVPLDGTPVSRLFDIAQDEDWFHLEAVAGRSYVVQTSNLAVGVDTIVEVYDLDGVTLLASDDNSGGGWTSYLEWQAPLDGIHFVRVTQASGSICGCDATYELSVKQIPQLYLPLVVCNWSTR